MSADTSSSITQSMALFGCPENTEPKFATILFIFYFFYPLRGVNFRSKIMSLEVQWIGFVPTFFKNAVLFDPCQKIKHGRYSTTSTFHRWQQRKEQDNQSIKQIVSGFLQHILQINVAKMSRFLRRKRDKTYNFNYI